MEITVEKSSSGTTVVTLEDGRVTYFKLGANFSINEDGKHYNIQSQANEGSTLDIAFDKLDTASKQGETTIGGLAAYWDANGFFLLQ